MADVIVKMPSKPSPGIALLLDPFKVTESAKFQNRGK